MCSLRTSSHDNMYFIASLCWCIPAHAVERAVKARLQSKLDAGVDELKTNHFYPQLFFFQISAPIQFRTGSTDRCQNGVGSVSAALVLNITMQLTVKGISAAYCFVNQCLHLL